ncbi:MAG: HNH endonuclease [Clostridiales bacterium]|nr:HNH endonuclease [Clostridiales bacterium]
MTLDDQMKEIADELSIKYGSDYVVTLKELYAIFLKKYGTKEGSINPSDYCYNRVNNGITLKKPTVFEYLGHGKYRCLGSNYPYNGNIYHKPKGQREFIVGTCINGDRIIASKDDFFNEDTDTNIDKRQNDHRTSRNPSMKLRFEILKRDNFKCCVCGASPAKNPMVELHVDHIIPWSRGGETIEENLQTLCSLCNYGKSNMI